MKPITYALAAAGVLVLVGFGAAFARSPKALAAASGLHGSAEKGAQEVTVRVKDSYEPAVIWVKPDETVHLTYDCLDGNGCGGAIVLASLGAKRSLQQGGATAVTFTPRKAFTCRRSMGLIRWSEQAGVTCYSLGDPRMLTVLDAGDYLLPSHSEHGLPLFPHLNRTVRFQPKPGANVVSRARGAQVRKTGGE